MPNAVQVTFGANIAPLVEGVNAIKEQIAGLGEAARVIAGIFAGGEIAEFVDKMANMGEQIERSSVMLGASVKTTQEFGYAAKMTGGDTQSMATAMERFEVSLQRAQNPTSQQALALKALGLSAKELIGLPLEQQMDKFADAVSRFADSPTKTAAIGAINRGFVQMLPLLDQGSEGLRRMRDQAEDTGAVMTDQTVKALSELDHSVVGARASLSALAGTLTALAGTTLGNFANDIAITAGHLTALASSGNLSAYVFGYLDMIVDGLGYRFVALAHAIANIATLDWGNVAKQWAEDEAKLVDHALAAGVDLDAVLNRATESYRKLLAVKNESDKPQVGALDVEGKDSTKAAAERAQAAIKAADESYKATEKHLAAEYKLHDITYSQETAALRAALDRRYAAEIAALASEEGLYAKGSAAWQKVIDQEMAAYQKFINEKRNLTDKANEQSAKDWEAAIKPIESAWNSQLRGLLSGTETWAQAMKKIAADLVIQIIEEFTKLALIQPIIKALSKSFDIADLAATIGKMITATIGPLFSGMAANLAPALGPSAVPVSAGIAASVEGIAYGMSKLDVGGTLLTDGVYYGHAGETVRPAQVNTPYGGDGGGDSHFHFHGTVIGTQQWIQQMKGQFADAVNSKRNLTPSMNFG